MAQTPNFGFYAVEPNDRASNVLDVLQATDGAVNTSNIMKIDSLLKQLQEAVPVLNTSLESQCLTLFFGSGTDLNPDEPGSGSTGDGSDSFKVVESYEEPSDMNVGDEWDHILEEVT